jgi:hypothetical protein
MKITHVILFPAFFALALALPAQEDQPLLDRSATPIAPPRDCSRVVQFELGDTQFASGDSITIHELRETQI